MFFKVSEVKDCIPNNEIRKQLKCEIANNFEIFDGITSNNFYSAESPASVQLKTFKDQILSIEAFNVLFTSLDFLSNLFMCKWSISILVELIKQH